MRLQFNIIGTVNTKYYEMMGINDPYFSYLQFLSLFRDNENDFLKITRLKDVDNNEFLEVPRPLETSNS
jgi:hypothetical protein